MIQSMKLEFIIPYSKWAEDFLRRKLDTVYRRGHNRFTRVELEAFERLVKGFEDALVFSRGVEPGIIWRPQPYIRSPFLSAGPRRVR